MYNCKPTTKMRNKILLKAKEMLNDKKGVFGLESVKLFFAIILGVALLAYVIVVVMGTLNSTAIIPQQSGSSVNETGFINSTGYTLSGASNAGFSLGTITAINASSNASISSGNWSVSTAGVVTNSTAVVWPSVKFTYSYTFNAQATNNANTILANTSTGVSGFFANVNPVYAILAILVIILVLVVLVRIVAGKDTMGAGYTSGPQL